MLNILSMDDFEVYIHALANGECTEEDVCTAPETKEACFSETEDDDSLTWIVRQLFESLDVWLRDGNLQAWDGTAYIRSVLKFIGHPVSHGRLISNREDDDVVDGDW